MQKTYVKPDVAFESFEMSTSIAAGCETIINYERNVCPWIVGDRNPMVIFTSAMEAQGICQMVGGDGVIYEDFCYHVSYIYFNS